MDYRLGLLSRTFIKARKKLFFSQTRLCDASQLSGNILEGKLREIFYVPLQSVILVYKQLKNTGRSCHVPLCLRFLLSSYISSLVYVGLRLIIQKLHS